MMIETKQLTKHYDTQIGCSNITLSVKPGHIFGLLGPNGAGKSTFVKMLVGLLRPTTGEGSISGFPLGTVDARRNIGYLPELFRYQDWLTAREVLQFHARLSGVSASEAKAAKLAARIREVLHEVGLGGRADDRVKQFSKGMQQRLGLANALLMDPALILLDEPSSALDPIGRYEVRTILEKLRQQGKTVFLNTHLLEDVETLCDEVAFLYHGELKAVGPLNSILGSSGNWELSVGGWDDAMLKMISGQAPFPQFSMRVKRTSEDGSVILEARAENKEQIGWLNGMLVEAGATLYEVRPINSKLEDWFLTMVDRKRGDEA